MSALLAIDRLTVRYDSRDVLRGLSLEVARGEIVALMGPSGVGKSTALRAVAALQPFDEGRIVVDGFALAPGPVPPESWLVPLRRRVRLSLNTVQIGASHSLLLPWVCSGPKPPGGHDSHATRTMHAAGR